MKLKLNELLNKTFVQWKGYKTYTSMYLCVWLYSSRNTIVCIALGIRILPLLYYVFNIK